MFSMKDPVPSTKLILAGFGLLCVTYFIFQWYYIPDSRFDMDELWFSSHIYQYLHALPYRDFPPYKTVLGYYLLSPAMQIAHDALTPLFNVKKEIALINLVLLGGLFYWAKRLFHPLAILITLALLFINHRFMIYSVDLRVDMLSAWCALFSVLFILSNRYALAGIVIAIGFLISQKIICFWIATNFALAIIAITPPKKDRIRQIVLFNLCVLIPIFLYVLFWATFSNLETVLQSVFYEAYLQSKITYYSIIYFNCWQSILASGPILILLWPATWFAYSWQPRRLFILLYSSISMLLFFSNLQAFPYQTVFLFPLFFVLYAEFFSWLLIIREEQTTLNPRFVFYVTAISMIFAIALITLFGIAKEYYLIATAPLFLYFIVVKRNYQYRKIFIILFVVAGVVSPLANLGFVISSFDGKYQHKMMIISNTLSKTAGGYFAGVPFIYDKDQAIPGLKNLITPAVDYLYYPNPKLLPLFLTSLYMTPRSADAIIADIQTKPIKFYINNFRIQMLPDKIRAKLYDQFEQFFGSIYIYAPKIPKTSPSFFIKFSGFYLVESHHSVLIDGHIIKPRSTITLAIGYHNSKTSTDYRLKYIPDNINQTNWGDDKVDYWYYINRPIVL